MNVKFHQVVDNIHEAIFYTSLEKKVIYTPFFHRLHDVNQCSTVYFSFPPNRTKRYEHSLGVMQLTSDIFYNASVNAADSDAMKEMIKSASDEFNKIVDMVAEKKDYILAEGEGVGGLLDRYKEVEFEKIKETIDNNFLVCFEDNCLLNFIPRSLQKGYESFLYICLMQSLRLVGLLHDVGHPPQSHIIESVMSDIYDELAGKKGKRNKREDHYYKILNGYINDKNKEIRNIDKGMAIKTQKSKSDALHEMIGLKTILYIIKWIIPNLVKRIYEWDEKEETKTKAEIYMFYYLTVFEFLVAFVRDKNIFFMSLHEIVDGVIDADRMDFIVRDASNSGVPWGELQYKRIINTAKLGLLQDDNSSVVKVVFSVKSVPEMDELLLNRYKIFTTINYHHQSAKMAGLYKRAVSIIAHEYLKDTNPDTSSYNGVYSDISGLWRCLEASFAKKTFMLGFIQWNDSWLNELLHEFLIENYEKNELPKQSIECRRFLREIFLNEEIHRSLIKRKPEVYEIEKAVTKELGETYYELEHSLLNIYKEYLTLDYKAGDEDSETKQEHFMELNNLESRLACIVSTNWSEIDKLFDGVLEKAIHKVLDSEKDEIESYVIEPISFDIGFRENSVYVYDKEGKYHLYEEYSDIKSKLLSMRTQFPAYYVYVSTKKHPLDESYYSELRKRIGKSIGEALKAEIDKHIELDIF